ncbi:exo-beta-1,3-glucanase [Cyathus striatus]|nr:exo-beta-1,3-glucanase [Cyathus striatus]
MHSLGAGTAGPNDPFWMQSIKHQGISAYNSDPAGYKVFRNVKDFGAVGDGVHDDTTAINAAINSQGRCGGGSCPSSTITPAVVFFPKGTYLVSTPIIAYYYTQLIGDARNPPTLLASQDFDGIAVIDADPYIPGGNGNQYYINQNNFFRVVRNFVIDVTRVPPEKPQGTGIHWQVSQATSLMNIVFLMSTAANTAHQGIWMENGSGGYMGDMVFYGGKFGLWVGNQQFTVKNVTINNAQTGVFSVWNWGWTYQGITFNNCQVGFDVLAGGALAIIDGVASNTPIFLRTSAPSNGTLTGAGSLVLNNIKLNNVPVAVGVVDGTVVLPGGTKTISSWGQGNVYRGNNGNGKFTQDSIFEPNKPSVLLGNNGQIFKRMQPQYEDYAVSQFVSVRDEGAKGDGTTDDTEALKAVFAKYGGCKIIFFDAGTYIVTSTITIPAGSRVVGEAWSVIAGKGPAFQDKNRPQAVVRVGEIGSQGVTEITDMLFTTVGPAAGAIIVEWNVKAPSDKPGGAAMFNSHIRIAGAAGTNLESTTCGTSNTDIARCTSSFLGLHFTPLSNAYLEGTWVWNADHDLDVNGGTQISSYSGRGILSESQGPVWLIGTASEHHVLYQYSLVNAKNHYMGLIQTESPYFQPNPPTPAPFGINPLFQDPVPFSSSASAWGLSVKFSQDILIFGAGLYSFFQNYGQDCLTTRNCQAQIANIDSLSSVSIYSLATVASSSQISVNGNGVIDQSKNLNGFVSMVTAWSSGGSSHFPFHRRAIHGHTLTI